MNSTNENKHLTLAEREIILTGISNGSTKTAIARNIGERKIDDREGNQASSGKFITKIFKQLAKTIAEVGTRNTTQRIEKRRF